MTRVVDGSGRRALRPVSMGPRPQRPMSFTFPDFPFNPESDVFPYAEPNKRLSYFKYPDIDPVPPLPTLSASRNGSQDTIVPPPYDSSDAEKAEPPPEAPPSKMSRQEIVIIMTALCLALFLAALDMTIISTSLPTISKVFNANESGYTWMASSYLLANASCVPLWGKLSDIWGRKVLILAANVLFLVGSLLCGIAPGLAIFLVGRGIQGVGGGGLIILGQICVSDLFSARERPVYYALFGATWAVAGALGPVIGGLLTQNTSWRWCFYINLPVGGICFVILFFFLKIESPKTPLLAGLRVIDWLGTVTIVGGTVMLLFGLEFGGVSFPWNSPTTIGLIIGGIVILVIFGMVERYYAKYPIMPPAVFDGINNILILGVNWVHAYLFISGAYFLPIYFQIVLGVGPTLSGVYILPQVMGLSVVAMLTGMFIRNTGKYVWIMRISMLVTTLGYGLFLDFQSHTSWPRLIIYQLISGIGIGPNFQAPLIAIQNNMPPGDVSGATSTFGFMRQLATSSSIVLGSVVYQNIINGKEAYLTEVLGPELAPKFLGSIAGANIDLIHQLTQSQKDIVLSEYTTALKRAWLFYTALSAIGCVFSFFVREKALNQNHEVTKTGLEEQERARLARIAAAKKPEERQTEWPGSEPRKPQ
ncbi:Vacuolar basic amino acid transporter 2 [Trichophyton interdigitale]|nr:Vacuolar basic amino acid transporter 2 [Trichophyton interdigitale]KAG5217194.1 Vacuolar basic amino acid transporter 2 [Trichophyton interdigitale]KAG8205770.1 Vacuolar basic amino acid transporter 2 [Trichophyton interdigitale]